MHGGRLDDRAGLELVLLSKLGVVLGAGGVVEGGVVGGLHAGEDEEDDGDNDEDPTMVN